MIKLFDFLEKFKVTNKNSEYTHHNDFQEFFKIPETDESTFLTLYAQELDNGKQSYIFEKHLSNRGPVIINFRFKFRNEKNNVIVETDVKNIVNKLTKILQDMFGYNHKFDCFVLQSQHNQYRKWISSLFIHFPYIIVDYSYQFLLRDVFLSTFKIQIDCINDLIDIYFKPFIEQEDILMYNRNEINWIFNSEHIIKNMNTLELVKLLSVRRKSSKLINIRNQMVLNKYIQMTTKTFVKSTTFLETTCQDIFNIIMLLLSTNDVIQLKAVSKSMLDKVQYFSANHIYDECNQLGQMFSLNFRKINLDNDAMAIYDEIGNLESWKYVKYVDLDFNLDSHDDESLTIIFTQILPSKNIKLKVSDDEDGYFLKFVSENKLLNYDCVTSLHALHYRYAKSVKFFKNLENLFLDNDSKYWDVNVINKIPNLKYLSFGCDEEEYFLRMLITCKSKLKESIKLIISEKAALKFGMIYQCITFQNDAELDDLYDKLCS